MSTWESRIAANNKEGTILERRPDFQSHTNNFVNNDDDRGGKNDDHGSNNVMKKKDLAGKDVVNDKKDGVNAGKDGVNAEKDGVNAVQDGEADEDLFVWPRAVQLISVVCPQTPQRVVTRSSPTKSIVKPPTYMSFPYMNKRTKVTSLIQRLEFVLGNSLFAMQGDKYETVFQTRSSQDLSSVRLNMETLAPRLWIDSNVIYYWWKVFSDEISAQFKHDVSSISLSEVYLAFFPIYASEHFYVVVFHLKSPSAMIILDNKKMFDLAFKFESENEEQRRISIIVNAIKNRDERDPTKTKTFIEN
nr:ulp1 protease family, C-terminal catalytic domain-containing protein [Tanacetum cinerariifolium]